MSNLKNSLNSMLANFIVGGTSSKMHTVWRGKSKVEGGIKHYNMYIKNYSNKNPCESMIMDFITIFFKQFLFNQLSVGWSSFLCC